MGERVAPRNFRCLDEYVRRNCRLQPVDERLHRNAQNSNQQRKWESPPDHSTHLKCFAGPAAEAANLVEHDQSHCAGKKHWPSLAIPRQAVDHVDINVSKKASDEKRVPARTLVDAFRQDAGFVGWSSHPFHQLLDIGGTERLEPAEVHTFLTSQPRQLAKRALCGIGSIVAEGPDDQQALSPELP